MAVKIDCFKKHGFEDQSGKPHPVKEQLLEEAKKYGDDKEAKIKAIMDMQHDILDNIHDVYHELGIAGYEKSSEETTSDNITNQKSITDVNKEKAARKESGQKAGEEISKEETADEVLNEDTGAEQPEAGAAPLNEGGEPPAGETGKVAAGVPEEDWSAIRKERLEQDIKGAKKLFQDNRKEVPWTESMANGLREVAQKYPAPTLYDSAKGMVSDFAQKYDTGVDFNPTTNELAAMQYFKMETGERISQLKGSESSMNDTQRLAAATAFDALHNDLLNVAKALNPQEAGRAFSFRQSEIRNDPNYGLQIRRMELMNAKGEPLNDADMKFTQELWDKEKEILKQEHELKMKGQQEEFENKLKQVQDEYEQKLKDAKAEKKQTVKEKTLSQKGKSVADAIRKLKTDKGSTKIDFTLGGWDVAVEGIAKLVEAGATVAEAIEKLIKDKAIGFASSKDKDSFENKFVREINNAARRKEAGDKIEEQTHGGIVTDINQYMVSKNLIKDFVDSYIGSAEPKEILSKAAEDLKKILPDATEEKLREAYIKQGDYKQPTKRQLETSVRKGQELLKKVAKKELKADQRQKIELQKEKDRMQNDINRFKKKIENEEYDEPEPTHLGKHDAELIRLEKERSKIESKFKKQQELYENKNKSWPEKIADFGRSAYVALLIGGTGTFAKIGAMSIARPLSEAVTKVTFGKIANMLFPGISRAAKRGGEGSSLRSIKKGFGAYFRQMGEEGIQKKIDKSEKEYSDALQEYNDYKNSANPSEAKLEKLKQAVNDKLIKATGNLAYQFIGGSSIKDAFQAFVYRSNQIEREFGDMGIENIREGNWLDKATYLFNFIGRSHSALKTFSGRYSFASSFMSRVEQAAADGEKLNSDLVLEIAHESYLDWERGKYQQNNAITSGWNDMISALDRKNKKNPEFNKYKKAFKKILQGDIAITRVPVNILHEQVMEYTLGVFKALYMARKEVNKQRKVAIEDFGIDPDSPEMKTHMKELISNMDEKQAATIIRSFRKGGLGLGLYGLALITGAVHFGVFPHKGQKKKKEEDELKPDELNPGQVMFGKNKFGEKMSGAIEHIPALWPMFMGVGMAEVYNTSLKKGKTEGKSAADAAMQHLEIIQNSIPQFKFGGPVELGKNIFNTTEKRLDEWGLLDDSPEGYTGKDLKDPVFKPYLERNISLPKEVPSMIKIKDEKTGTEKTLPEYGREVQKKYETTRTGFLKQNLKEIEDNGVVYVDKYGHASTTEGEDKKETKVTDLTTEQRKEVLKIAASKATSQAKKKMFYENE
jgi:hypothetical protein